MAPSTSLSRGKCLLHHPWSLIRVIKARVTGFRACRATMPRPELLTRATVRRYQLTLPYPPTTTITSTTLDAGETLSHSASRLDSSYLKTPSLALVLGSYHPLGQGLLDGLIIRCSWPVQLRIR
jgi:hypothetical protein